MNSKLANIFQLLLKIFKETPVISFLTFIIPLLSGLLTFYTFSAQKNLINLIPDHSGTTDWKDLLHLAMFPILVYVSIYALQSFSSSVTNILKSKMNANITYSFQSEIANVASKIDFKKFDDKEFGNTLQRAKSVVGEDMDGITGFLVATVGTVSSLISVIWLAATNGYFLITLIVSLLIISNLVIRMMVEVKVRKVGKEVTFDGRMSEYFSDSLLDANVLRELKVYNAFHFFLDLWGKVTLRQYNQSYGARKYEIKIGMFLAIIQTTAIFIVLVYLLNKMNGSDSVTIGGISVLFLALLSVGGQVMSLSIPLSRLYMSSYKLSDLHEVLKWGEGLKKTHDNRSKTEISDPVAPIVISKLYFKYSNSERYILSDINMRITKGEKIALVGENGAGKSTLIKLILDQYKPTSGEIQWNGQSELSGDISIVFQSFIRFELTLRENITLGNMSEHHNDQKIIETLKICELMDLYYELGGLDVVVGQVIEGGRQLSGGQWQKLAIARALYHDAELIIFDEMTSAIDPSSEVKIFNKLIEVCQNKTAIFISHRLGWTKNVDCIYVLENGRIVEHGKHNELMNYTGVYSQMYNQQAFWYS
ncbi:ABC transporter ATP-binding protein [Bacillus sp. SD088]|uniref:ABC transporter ATP-binding protein n=1 Tax=Bacillus sp. SD088 TaxID=2782012 RepID=UPI001A96FE5D|nr:ABC transporter ATP-binding protein [Bacillus sp. SD088]MBO0994246.1 ABC transporter ATP-binding protein [Bacillus sp. SD088]